MENVSSVTISNTITIMDLSIFRDLPVNTENANFLMFFCSTTQFQTHFGYFRGDYYLNGSNTHHKNTGDL